MLSKISFITQFASDELGITVQRDEYNVFETTSLGSFSLSLLLVLNYCAARQQCLMNKWKQCGSNLVLASLGRKFNKLVASRRSWFRKTVSCIYADPIVTSGQGQVPGIARLTQSDRGIIPL